MGPERRAFVADFHGAVSRASLIALVEEALGSIETLVINSGGPSAGRFEVADDDRWAGVVDQHVLAAATLLRTVLPGMRARRWGRIVMVTSCSVKQPSNEMIVRATVYLTNMDDFAVVNSVYARYFPSALRTRVCVEVSRLPLGALVEIDAIAKVT